MRHSSLDRTACEGAPGLHLLCQAALRVDGGGSGCPATSGSKLSAHVRNASDVPGCHCREA